MLLLLSLVLSDPEVELSADGLFLYFKGSGTINKTFAQSKGNKKGIQKINIDGPDVLGERAFGYFTSLEYIEISDTVKEIQQYCFESCSSLIEFTFPKNIRDINSGLFLSCTSLYSVRFYSSVKSINTIGLFRKCINLCYFYISLDNSEFSTDDSHHFITSKNGSILYCASAIPNQIIPSLITTISSRSYSSLSINSINFSQSSVSIIKSSAFFIVKIEALVFPKSLTRIESSAFYQSNISCIHLPSSLKYFDRNTLLEISVLKELKVENSEALIDDNGYIFNPNKTMLFFVNPSVKNIKVSSEVTNIEYAAVRNTHVQNISVSSGNKKYSSFGGLLYNDIGTVLLACPGGKQDVIVSSKCLTIGDLAFRFCNVKTVKLNDGIQSINYQGFLGCSCLESINFPSSIQHVQSYAFSNTTSLSLDVKFGSNLETLGANSFRKSKITSIDLSECNKIKMLGNRIFYDCSLRSIKLPLLLSNLGEEVFLMSGIESIELGSNVTTILKRCFNECHNLTQINISKTKINDIPESCFESSGITSINIPSTVVSISSRAFANCINLKSITFLTNSNLSIIFPYIIDGCESLKTFTIPSSVKTISDGAFANSYGLLNFIQTEPSELFVIKKGVLFTENGNILYAFPGGRTNASIDDNVKEIRSLSFAGCIHLKSVKFGINSLVKTFGESTFLDCSKLEEVILPGGLISFNSSTFEGCKNIQSVSFAGESLLKEFPSFCFKGCSKLSYCEFPMSTETIGDSSFENCSLKRISLWNLSKIGSNAFSGCRLLESVWIWSSISSIAKDSYDNCISLSMFSFCGSEFHDINFINCSLKIVLVTNSYQSDKFGKLSVFRILDGDCLIPTHFFTSTQGAGILGHISLFELIGSTNEMKTLREV